MSSYRGRGKVLWEREELEIAIEQSGYIRRAERALAKVKELDPEWEAWYESHVPPWMQGMRKQAAEILEGRVREILEHVSSVARTEGAGQSSPEPVPFEQEISHVRQAETVAEFCEGGA